MILGGFILADEARVGGDDWVGPSFEAAHAVLDDLFADVNPTKVAADPLRPAEEASE